MKRMSYKGGTHVIRLFVMAAFGVDNGCHHRQLKTRRNLDIVTKHARFGWKNRFPSDCNGK